MIKGEIILMLAYNRWSDNDRTSGEFVSRLSQDNFLIVVEIPLRYEELRPKEGLLLYLKKLFTKKVVKINDKLIVVTPPPMFPLYISLLSRVFRPQIAFASLKLSKLFQSYYLKRKLRLLRLQPTILFFFEPFDLLLVGRFGERIACYRTYDEIVHFFSNKGIADVIEQLEKQNIRKADLVFCSSLSQYKKRKVMHPCVHIVPNAANFQLFNQALVQIDERPEDLCGLRPPLIGYIGVIDYRLDFDLLKIIVTKHPGWTLVLVGPVRDYNKEKAQELTILRNVHFLGRKPASDVPKYLRWFDVALIPFLVTPSTNTMYPYKLHEYLAMGKTVVSTDLEELRVFDGLVRLGKCHAEFVRAVEEELSSDSDEKQLRRIEVARKNSWDDRMAQMSRLIEDKSSTEIGR